MHILPRTVKRAPRIEVRIAELTDYFARNQPCALRDALPPYRPEFAIQEWITMAIVMTDYNDHQRWKELLRFIEANNGEVDLEFFSFCVECMLDEDFDTHQILDDLWKAPTEAFDDLTHLFEDEQTAWVAVAHKRIYLSGENVEELKAHDELDFWWKLTDWSFLVEDVFYEDELRMMVRNIRVKERPMLKLDEFRRDLLDTLEKVHYDEIARELFDLMHPDNRSFANIEKFDIDILVNDINLLLDAIQSGDIDPDRFDMLPTYAAMQMMVVRLLYIVLYSNNQELASKTAMRFVQSETMRLAVGERFYIDLESLFERLPASVLPEIEEALLEQLVDRMRLPFVKTMNDYDLIWIVGDRLLKDSSPEAIDLFHKYFDIIDEQFHLLAASGNYSTPDAGIAFALQCSDEALKERAQKLFDQLHTLDSIYNEKEFQELCELVQPDESVPWNLQRRLDHVKNWI